MSFLANYCHRGYVILKKVKINTVPINKTCSISFIQRQRSLPFFVPHGTLFWKDFEQQ